MQTYRLWVLAHPYLSAALQFGLLGTLGEGVAASLRARRLTLPCSVPQLLLKVVAWAILGLVIVRPHENGRLPVWRRRAPLHMNRQDKLEARVRQAGHLKTLERGWLAREHFCAVESKQVPVA